MANTSLFDDLVTITYDYLGPAADRFVVRQIRNLLDKDPAQLEQNDLRQLIDWIQIAMRLVTDDPLIVDRYVADLESMARQEGN
jgi:hypothetical protein